jgi:prepilin-type N-terminal cleavage/methylation domain-containing protein/prepilin-type processing-associated H-X9-DG protein
MIPPSAKNRAGFTLTELLIVIAIIGILAALLFPALNASRQKSEAASCVNNLRRIYTAAAQYEADNDGYLPLPFRRSGDPSKDFSGSPLEEWTDKLPPYLGMKSMSALINVVPTSQPSSPLICPTQYRLKPQMVTYSQNHNLGGENMLSSRLQYPIKRTMVLAQEGAANRLPIRGSTIPYFMDGWFYDVVGRYTTWRNMQHTAGNNSFPHDGCAHVCFLDGHIEATRVTEWLWKDVSKNRPVVAGTGLAPW